MLLSRRSAAAGAGAVTALLVLVLHRAAIRPTFGLGAYSDFPHYADAAQLWLRGGPLDVIQPLLSVLIVALVRLSGGALPVHDACLLICAVAAAALAVAVFCAVPADPDAGPVADAAQRAVWTVALVGAAPITLLTMAQHHLYWGYLTYNPYHSATFTVLRPLALLQFLLAVHLLAGQPRPLWAARLGMVVVSLLGCLTKVSFTLAFFPALGLWFLADRGRLRSPQRWLSALLAVVPVAVTLLFLRRNLVQHDGGLAFSLFEHWREGAVVQGGKLLLSLAFPLAVTLGCWQTARRSPALGLAWCAQLVGLVLFLGLTETGPRRPHANLMWTPMAALLPLFVASAQVLRAALRRREGWPALGAVVLTVHAACGVAWWRVWELGESLKQWR